MVATSLSDSQVEALLAGSEGYDQDLQPVADLLAAVRCLVQSDAEADFSDLFAAVARESRVTPIEWFTRDTNWEPVPGSATLQDTTTGWRELTRRWVSPRR
jgi:hypothetical protein